MTSMTTFSSPRFWCPVQIIFIWFHPLHHPFSKTPQVPDFPAWPSWAGESRVVSGQGLTLSGGGFFFSKETSTSKPTTSDLRTRVLRRKGLENLNEPNPIHPCQAMIFSETSLFFILQVAWPFFVKMRFLNWKKKPSSIQFYIEKKDERNLKKMFRRKENYLQTMRFWLPAISLFMSGFSFDTSIHQQNSVWNIATPRTLPFPCWKINHPNYSLRLLAMLYSAFVFAYMPAAGLSLNSLLAIQGEFGWGWCLIRFSGVMRACKYFLL